MGGILRDWKFLMSLALETGTVSVFFLIQRYSLKIRQNCCEGSVLITHFQVYAARDLLFPMYWQHVFIPVLPEGQSVHGAHAA